MKLLHSFAILALFVLVVPSHGAGWNWLSNNKEEVKSVEPEPKKTDQLVMQNDEEEVDGDYSEQDSMTVVKDLPPQDQMGGEEVKTKIQINDEEDPMLTNIQTISELPSQQPFGNGTAPHEEYPAYDRTPQQSEFLDRSQPHPTESQGMDPRFAARPRQCAEGQYLCRKAFPSQEHVRCIPDSWKCNGVRDCEENDDEEGCSFTPHRPTPNGCIYPHQYTCANTGVNGIPAICIAASKLCDGNYDCTYGDDESSDRCQNFRNPEYAQRREESSIQPGAPDASMNGADHQQAAVQPLTNGPNVQQAPPVYNPYVPQPHQAQPSYAQPQQPAPQPEQCNGGKSVEYVKRLEWIDRCFRSCLKN